MEGKYTQQDIDQFFSQFKKLSKSYELIKVHQLINNPDAKAKHLVKFYHKPFKLIIMTGTLILVISAIILWLTPENSNKTINTTEKSLISIEYSKQEEKIENHNSVVTEENSKSVKPKTSLLAEDNSVNESNDITESKVLTNHEAEKNEIICQSCDWPQDTILDKKELLIYLSDSELEKLGIYKNDTSGYFETNYEHSNTWVYNKGDIVFKNKVNSNKFGLTFITDTSLTEPSLSLFRSYDGFYLAMDTLVPIVITFKNGLKPEILWFSLTEDLFKQLPTRYKHLQKTYSCIKEIKNSQRHKQVVAYRNFDSIQNELIKIPIIELNDDELKNIFIESYSGYFSVRNIDNSKYFWVDESKKTYGIDCNYETFRHNFFPIFITDSKGRHRRVDNNFDIHDKNIIDSIKNENINLLIPIKIYLKDIRIKENEITLWYLPTDEFIDALPERIKNELKIERDEIIADSTNSKSTCTYFEVCKSTLTVEDLKVYPNPANQSVTIDFSIYKSTTGNISLFNMGGSQVKILVSNTTFVSGYNSFNADLSTITPGIYIVSVLTEKEFITQRLIISR